MSAPTTTVRQQSPLPGLALAGGIAAAAMGLRQASGVAVLSPMIVAVLAGLIVGSLWRVPASIRPGLALATRPVLRAGIVLLGFQITLGHVLALGPAAFAVSALTLLATFLAVRLVGRLLGVSGPLGTLIAAGTAVCGASAVIAANPVAQGDDEDVAYAIACVTIFGTLAMLAAPLLAGPLGLAGESYGIWVGASVHEVAQVTAAAFQLGDAAGHAGTVAKLIRVMLLAPLVLGLALALRGQARGGTSAVPVPWFVFGFIAVMLVNSALDLPAAFRSGTALLATFLLSTGLAGMGLMTDPRRLRARGTRPLLLGAFGAIFAAGFAAVAVIFLHP